MSQNGAQKPPKWSPKWSQNSYFCSRWLPEASNGGLGSANHDLQSDLRVICGLQIMICRVQITALGQKKRENFGEHFGVICVIFADFGMFSLRNFVFYDVIDCP